MSEKSKQFGNQNSNASQEWCSIRPDQLQLIGDAIRPGNYRQHSVFRRVANYTCEKGLVSLVDQSVGAGPFNLVMSHAPVKWPEIINITPYSIEFDGDFVSTGTIPVYVSILDSTLFHDVDILEPWVPESPFADNIERIKHWLETHAPPRSLVFLLTESRVSDFSSSVDLAFVDRMLQAVDTWKTGAFTCAAAMAQGCGFGLTPSGDDFNAGLITGLHVIKQIAEKLGRQTTQSRLDFLITRLSNVVMGTNPLVNAFLEASINGRVNALQKELIQSLFFYSSSHHIEITEKFIAIGATSGSDWLTGLLFILEKEFELWLSLAE